MEANVINGQKQSDEINRAKDEIAKLAECLQSRRVRAFSRQRLLRVQTDLAMLISRLAEIQRVVSISMMQRGRNDVVVVEPVPSMVRTPISLGMESMVVATPVESFDSMAADWK